MRSSQSGSPIAPPPIVWTIAGTDPTSGAGLQADLATCQNLGVYGCSVITSVLAQNSRTVDSVELMSADTIERQLKALWAEMPPRAVKIGMTGSNAAIRMIADAFEDSGIPLICDPVIQSSSGADLLPPQALKLFQERMVPLATLLTPNRPEVERLTGKKIETDEDVEEAADRLLEMGCAAVLIKGGHSAGDWVQDFWSDGSRKTWLTAPRLDVQRTRGTGCILSSAIAACMARGMEMIDALVLARTYVQQGLRTAPQVGLGENGPIGHLGWPSHSEDLPWLTDTAAAGRRIWKFPTCGSLPIGVYPIVDGVGPMKELLSLGVDVIQLRIKQSLGPVLEDQIRESIRLAQAYSARLYVNDHWRTAVACNAYGVHLGQEDISDEAATAMENAGCRLGLSASSYSELARAWAYRPSCIGIGTVYATNSKQCDYAPLGVDGFAALRALAPAPVVAIGGISVENAEPLLQAGADGMAVISDLSETSNLPARLSQWRRLFGRG